MANLLTPSHLVEDLRWDLADRDRAFLARPEQLGQLGGGFPARRLRGADLDARRVIAIDLVAQPLAE